VIKPSKFREVATHVAEQHDDKFAEAITGWATNLFFPLPDIPNRYHRLPWRRIFRSRGAIRGVLFVLGTLTRWPFELLVEVLRPGRDLADRIGCKSTASEFKYGDHVCYLYRSDYALQRALVRYVHEGLEKGDQCVCVESDRVQAKLRLDLQSHGVDVEKELARGSLVFLSGRETYFENGEFNPQRLLSRLSELMDQSVQEGFSGLRVAGEIPVTSGDQVFAKQLIDYERQSDAYFAERNAIGFCHFRVDSLPLKAMDSVIDAHGLHIVEPVGVGTA
jgi:hypothetical protein